MQIRALYASTCTRVNYPLCAKVCSGPCKKDAVTTAKYAVAIYMHLYAKNVLQGPQEDLVGPPRT